MAVTIQCAREDCGHVFEVDPDAESARCPACGRDHPLDDVTGHDDGTPTEHGESDADVAVSGTDLRESDLVIEIRIRLEDR
jgi:hypothetical protein